MEDDKDTRRAEEKSQIRRGVSKRESSTVEVAFRLLYNIWVLRRHIKKRKEKKRRNCWIWKRKEVLA